MGSTQGFLHQPQSGLQLLCSSAHGETWDFFLKCTTHPLCSCELDSCFSETVGLLEQSGCIGPWGKISIELLSSGLRGSAAISRGLPGLTNLASLPCLSGASTATGSRVRLSLELPQQLHWKLSVGRSGVGCSNTAWIAGGLQFDP